MVLPAGYEWPGVIVAVELTGGPAEEHPVFLRAKGQGRGHLKFVPGLDSKRRQGIWTVVGFQDLPDHEHIGVGGVQINTND